MSVTAPSSYVVYGEASSDFSGPTTISASTLSWLPTAFNSSSIGDGNNQLHGGRPFLAVSSPRTGRRNQWFRCPGRRIATISFCEGLKTVSRRRCRSGLPCLVHTLNEAMILAAKATAWAFFQLTAEADAFEAYAGEKGSEHNGCGWITVQRTAIGAKRGTQRFGYSTGLFSFFAEFKICHDRRQPGSAVDLPCVSTATFTNGTHTLLAGFAQNFSGYSGTFAASSSSYYAVDRATNTKRSGNAVLNTTPNNLTETTVGLESNGTFCVGLHVVVPATAAPGKYYNTLRPSGNAPDGLAKSDAGSDGNRPADSCSDGNAATTPTPTATPCSPSRDLFVTTEMSSGVAVCLAFPPETNGNLAPQFTISGTNTGLVTPEGIVSDANGNLFVASTAYSNGGIAVFHAVHRTYPKVHLKLEPEGTFVDRP